MTKLYIHAQTLIDGISDAPKKDQLITVEDDKIIKIARVIIISNSKLFLKHKKV